jgi:hypothetical protein
MRTLIRIRTTGLQPRVIITHHAYDDLVALAQPRSAQCISVLTCDAEACAAWVLGMDCRRRSIDRARSAAARSLVGRSVADGIRTHSRQRTNSVRRFWVFSCFWNQTWEHRLSDVCGCLRDANRFVVVSDGELIVHHGNAQSATLDEQRASTVDHGTRCPSDGHRPAEREALWWRL